MQDALDAANNQEIEELEEGSDFLNDGDTDPDAEDDEIDETENDLDADAEDDGADGGSVDGTEQPLDTDNLVYSVLILYIFICAILKNMVAPNDNVIDPDSPTRGLIGRYSNISERQFYKYRMAMRENKKGAFHWLW